MTLIILLYMLFASTFTLGKAALLYIQPIFFIGLRMIIAGILLLGYQYFFNRARWRYEWRDTVAFSNIAIFLIFIAFVGEFWAMKYISAAKACLFYNASPFITAFFSYLLLHERLTRKQWMGLCIGFLGFLPIIIHQSATELVTAHVGIFSMPELLMVVSVISACYGWIVMKYLVTSRAYSPIMVNGVAMFAGGILALVTSFFIEGKPHIIPALHPLFNLSPELYAKIMLGIYTLALIIIANIICFNLYSTLLRRYSVTFISFAGFTTPLFAALFDLFFFKKMVPVAFFATIGIVSIGLFLFYQDELRLQSK